MGQKADKDLALLRDLILGADYNVERLRQELLELKGRVGDKEALLGSLDPIFTDLLERKVNNAKEDMAEILSPVMADAIRTQVAETNDDVVDALYPVIGKTIRRSVAEAMKTQFSSVNKRIEETILRSFLPTWLRARLMGVDKNQLLVHRALPFQIHQVFLIHKETGLLIAHVAAEEMAESVDRDLVSGMLTAIRDFVSHAFRSEEQELDEIHYGDAKIILEMGRYSYLAIVVTGFQPPSFNDALKRLDRRVHNAFHRELRSFNGDASPLSGVTEILSHFIARMDVAEEEEVKKKKRHRPYLLYLTLTLILVSAVAIGALYGPRFFKDRKLKKEIALELEAAPWYREQNVGIHVRDHRVLLTGRVNTFESKTRIEELIKTIPNVQALENRLEVLITDVRPEEITVQLQRRMTGYDSVKYFKPTFLIEKDQVILTGYVPSQQAKREIGLLISDIPGVRVVTNNLIVLNDRELLEVRSYLRENAVWFAPLQTQFAPDQTSKLEAVLNLLHHFEKKSVKLIVRGYSDDAKDFYANLELSRKRAQCVKEYFLSRQMNPEDLIVLSWGEKVPQFLDSSAAAHDHSRVEFDILMGR